MGEESKYLLDYKFALELAGVILNFAKFPQRRPYKSFTLKMHLRGEGFGQKAN